MNKSLKKFIWGFGIILLLSHQNITFAENVPRVISDNSKKISLKAHNKSLTWVLNKLASEADLDLIIPPDFKEKNISVNISDKGINESFNIICKIGNFHIVNQDGYLVVMPIEIKEIKTQVFNLTNIKAIHLSYILQNTFKYNKNFYFSFDDLTNSVVIKSTEKTLNEVSDLIKQYDLPKKSISITLENQDLDQIIKSMQTKLFTNSKNDNINENALIGGLDVSFDESVGYMIKGKIHKNDVDSIIEEKPIIFAQNDRNKITVIGNAYQVSLAEEYLGYFQKPNTTDISNTINTENTNASNDIKIYKQELIKSKELLEETRETLSKVINVIQKKDNELNEALSEIVNLKEELKSVKSKKLWKILSDRKKAIEEEESSKENKEIVKLKEEIIGKERKIISYSKDKESLEKELANKDSEITVLTNKLNDAKEEIHTLISQNNMPQEDSNIAKETISLLAMTKEELNLTKKDLGKVRQQLDDSKKQLNLIYGGSLLDNITMPNDKSEWFK